ncbi:MAG: hypothetical protein J6P93_00635 [Alphaproteobacteria bacterium]|nr:hypothetical protein [Alphaproteobacteria bacterium]
MNNFDYEKEIKEANERINVWRRTSDAFFLTMTSSAAVSTIAFIFKLFNIPGAPRLSYLSLCTIGSYSVVSTFFMAAMANIVKTESVYERDFLKREKEKQSQRGERIYIVEQTPPENTQVKTADGIVSLKKVSHYQSCKGKETNSKER